MLVDRGKYYRTLHYGYNTTWPQNIAAEVKYGHKVSEPGTFLI